MAVMQHTDTTSTPKLCTVLDRPFLDELRKAHGIETETDLAKVIGVDRVTLYRVSKLETAPSNEFITKVRQAFPAASLDKLFVLGYLVKQTKAA